MININDEQTLYDVVELLLKHKDEAIESIYWYMVKIVEKERIFNESFSIDFDDVFKKTVLQELRAFAVNKLNIPAENAIAFIDDDILDICPELDFYFEKETYYGNI